ncbi:MAG TPA: UDP-glucose 4-epimerase GalE [Polyangia bacterium]|jgi:UDP-glucose-4-epimerase GalE|nr:UDP-glucose 4-epimerase GalE [Polyangia bacterium]
MSILIVGGAGYIGSHTAKIVAAANAGLGPLVVFDNLSSGHRWALRWGTFEEGDLNDPTAIAAVIKRHAVTAVIQFAAFIEVGESVRDPRKYFRGNVQNTLNLLDAMVDAGVRDLVFSSTAAVYGDPIKTPIPEDHPLLPVSPYGDSKLFVETILRRYGQAYGLRWAALRYFNAAGADPDGGNGEDHAPESHLIPLAIKAALGQRGPLQVFGTDYPTPDGTAVRDYVHVVDLAHAHLLALQYLAAGQASLVANIGTGHGHSVREVLAAVEKAAGRPVPHQEVARRPGDSPELVADASRARALLGWQPRYAELDTIVSHACQWHVSQSKP